MILNCPECAKEFIPPQKELNRGNGKVCSKAYRVQKRDLCNL